MKTLTLHEAEEDQRSQARHRHGQQQDAAATAPVYGRPEQQPSPSPCTHGQQVGPVEAGGGASDITSERAVTVTNAVRDESGGERAHGDGVSARDCLSRRRVKVNVKPGDGRCSRCVEETTALGPKMRADLRGEAKHTHVLPDVPAVEELGEGQVRASRGGGL